VVAQVLQRTLAGDDRLHEEAKHGEHSQAAVLDFLDLEFGERIGIVGEAQGVEGTAGIEAVETLRPFKVATVVPVALNGTHEDDLDDQGGGDGVGVDQSLVAEVLDALIGEDLGTGLEPGDVTGVGAPLGDEAAEGAEHGPAGVDDLELAVAGKGFGVCGETGGVPAVISGEFTLEVRRRGGEGAQELGAVGTIPAGMDGRREEKREEAQIR
jgi:hypothetical protein